MEECHTLQSVTNRLRMSLNFHTVSALPGWRTGDSRNKWQRKGKFRVVGGPPGSETGRSQYECRANVQFNAGVAVRIKQLCAAPELQERLRDIGFCEDQIIRLITSQTNFICQVCNARLAISEQLAQLILVEPVNQPV